MSSEDRNLEPTPRHRQKMREKGEVALSRDLVSASMLLTGMLLFWGVGGFLAEIPVREVQNEWTKNAWLNMTPDLFLQYWNTWVNLVLWKIVPFLALVPIVVSLVSLIQTRFLFLPSRLAPNWKHVNPAEGLTRICSLDSLTATIFGLLKVLLVAVFVIWMVFEQFPVLGMMYQMSFQEAVEKMRSVVLGTGLKISAALFLLALADYGWQFYRHQTRLRMTYEEMKEEIRITEGDASVKQKMRQRLNDR